MNILTINAEDWFHAIIKPGDKDWDRFSYRVDILLLPMLQELEKRGIRAVVFCTGWLAACHPEIVKTIAKMGHIIGCNGYWHDEPNKMSKEEFIADLSMNKTILEQVSGKDVDAYRAPNFAAIGIEDWYFDALAEMGFRRDFSFIGKTPYKVICHSGKSIEEWPVSKYKGIIPYSGGGFFRLMPYVLIKYFMNHSEYVMTYFHPRDFDTRQPRWAELSLKDRCLCYVGLSGSWKKWINMLDDFDFQDLDKTQL